LVRHGTDGYIMNSFVYVNIAWAGWMDNDYAGQSKVYVLK